VCHKRLAYSFEALEGVHELDINICLVISALSLIFEAVRTTIWGLLLMRTLLIKVKEVIELVPDLLSIILIPRRATLPGPSLPLNILPETLPSGLIILPLLIVHATLWLCTFVCFAHTFILIVGVDPALTATSRSTEVHVLEGGATKTHLLVISILL
jgi:hypothetical protein